MSLHSPAPQRLAAPVQISAAQRGLWLVHALHPGSSTYNVFCTAQLRGPLDPAALHAAIRTVVARHEVLRTAFPAVDGAPEPVVRPAVELPLPVFELPGASAEQIALHTRQWCEQPFDLESDVLLRVALWRLAPEHYVFCLSTHHIVADAHSLQVFFQELATLYPAGAELEPLPTQYSDYVGWHRARVDQVETLDWWAEYLAGVPDVLTLPGDHARPAVRSSRGGTVVRMLPAELMTQAIRLARRRRMSPFMVLLAAFGYLICRLGATTEAMVGVPVSDRGEPEFEPLIGLFVNTLPVRIRTTEAITFADLLDQVRDSALGALAHRAVSFDQLVERLRASRSPAHTPLVQVAFSADLAPPPGPRLAGLDVEVAIPQPTTAKFDLDVSIDQAADPHDGYAVVYTYSADLFEAGSVDRLAARFYRLLAAVVSDPDRPLAGLPLLADAERAELLHRWSEDCPGYPGAPPVHELFAEQAARQPAAAAVSLNGREYSYAEIDARADRIAAGLQAHGVVPEQVVGVLQHRGVDLITTLLAVLKAGAAYLPLSPAHPSGYLRQVLHSAGARQVVTEPELAARLAGTDAEALTVAELSAGSAQVRPVRLHPSNLAYVLYTSGSTGEPKGVAVTHQAVSNVALGMRTVYGLTAADRVLQFANVCFDITVEELYPAWSVGACVVLTDDPPPNPADMAAMMADQRITFTILTSSYWRRWTQAAAAAGVHPGPYLRRISIGAEPVDVSTLRAWQRDVGLPVFNCYGLTETTVNATVARLADASDSDLVPAGRPVDGASAYVLDRNLEPVPVGVEGELYIGGACLARGYLGRPGLTAERFLPHPFVAGGRLHRTGDRARWLPDGSLEVLGRADSQLKVRGYRIEPGHIESILCQHPDVSSAVVTVHDDRLIGYLVPRAGRDVPKTLRDHLSRRLPTYLVPDTLVPIAEIPLNRNGKADLKALPAPTVTVRVGVPPRTDTERRLAEVWQAALGVEAVGVHDNFFDLGGNSMALATVHARLPAIAGRSLPLVTLYEYPTIGGLAQYLTTSQPAHPPDGDERAERLRAGRDRRSARRGQR